MSRLRRINDKVRFEVVSDLEGSYAVLYGESKISPGQWLRVGTCHMSVIDFIAEAGAKRALEDGLIKLDEAKS